MDLSECLKSEVSYRTSRSSGPGGQHVNKTETKVEILWMPSSSQCLNDAQKNRVLRRLGSRLTGEGTLILASEISRSQLFNKKEVTERFLTLVAECLVVPKKRIPGRPTVASRLKRLRDKKRKGEIKKMRGRPPDQNL